MITASNTINYTDFNPVNLKFTKLEENDRSNGQLVGYPRYNRNGIEIPLEIQLPWIRLFTYGVPQLNQFYKTDNDRAHLRLPLDLNIPEIAEFAEKLKQIDAIMGSPEMMESLLGKKSKKYKYQPLYRESIIQEEDSDEENEVKKKKSSEPRPPYFKLKLKLSYPDKKVESKIFESEETSTGKRVRTKMDASTIDEFAHFVRYKSLIRPVMKPFKIWAHPLSKKDPEFGISCRLERIEVDKASISGLYNSTYESETFIDSENDEELPLNNLKIDSKLNNYDDSSDDEVITKPSGKDDNQSDSDLEESNLPKLQKTIAQVDSDESDEEIVVTKPVVKKEMKKTKNSKKST
jgi:hypothetical protein